MPYARIWYEPTGVKITYFTDGANVDQVVNVLKKDGHVHQAATFEDVETEAELRTLIPADRTDRAKWGKAQGRRGVEVKP